MMRLWGLALMLYLFWGCMVSPCRASDVPVGFQRSEEAYVTLLYGDEFLLGVRVLGKSIRDSGSKKDMVALVSDGVSDYGNMLLQADGWIVKTISLLENPNEVHPKRFWGVYTKLKIFNMTNYRKVVFLDADTIVLKNIDDLFKCHKFCATLRHSERLNSGVMVVEPSEKVFMDMMAKVRTLYSYTGGDQGFLNSYFPDFANALIFDPHATWDELNSRPIPEMERLSTLYNADVGLYMLANKWMVKEDELRVIHYTLGPLKPWDWWTNWLIKPADAWQNIRVKLEATLPGTAGGQTPQVKIIVTILFVIPLILLVFCYHRSHLQLRALLDHTRHLYYKLTSGSGRAYSSANGSNRLLSDGAQSKVPAFLGAVSVVVSFVAALVSIALSFMIIPSQVMPWTGFLLLYEWTSVMFFLLFGTYLHAIRKWGRHVADKSTSVASRTVSSDHDSGKGPRQISSCDSAACYYGVGIASLALAVPLLPSILGLDAIFLRLGVMVAGGVVFASFLTYASETLSIRAFCRGYEDRDTQRVRHFLC